jgi:hypothetical protein
MPLTPILRRWLRWRLERRLMWNTRYVKMYREAEKTARAQIDKLEREQPQLNAEINRLK